jgi:hypothetical protein
VRMTAKPDKLKYRRYDNKTDPVSFSVRPVPDSHRQEGSFKGFNDRGSLLSLVTIEPSVPIELDLESDLQLLVPVMEDASTDCDLDTCSQIVSGLQVLSVDDIGELDAEPDFVDYCTPALIGEVGGRGNCSCSATVKHFSTFAVVDSYVEAALVELTSDELELQLKTTWNSSFWYGDEEITAKCASEARNWEDVLPLQIADTFRTGGLGSAMVPGQVEVWGCFQSHSCIGYLESFVPNAWKLGAANASMCYVYHESIKRWLPWAPNSLVKLTKKEW